MVGGPLRRLLSGTLGASLSSSAGGATDPAAPSVVDGSGAAGGATTGDALDICLLSYRSDPHSGGQGVYVKFLSRALTALGHSVDVISGRPYPEVDDEVGLIELPGENVVDEPDRLGQFDLSYLRHPDALFEWASALTGGFPDPYLFGRRVRRYFAEHEPAYDVVHDNQSLCYALPWLREQGYPVVATIHHPITVDREVTLAEAEGLRERLFVRRWYRFLQMQRAVAADLDHIVSVSEWAGRRAVADFGTDPDAVRVVHNGIDTDLFEPRDRSGGDAHQLMTTVSADAPIKGVRYLLRALARVRERVGQVELTVVGEFNDDGEAARLVTDLGLGDCITTYAGISHDQMVDLYGAADLAVVPSLYEGFGLPAGEAMACGVPVVATDGGALPEVVGDAGVTVPAGDAGALADGIVALLEDPARRARLADRGRERIVRAFDWERTARETVREYRRAIHGDR